MFITDVNSLFKQLNHKNTTVFFYELDFADSQTNATAYKEMPWTDLSINGETVRVIDLDNDGNFNESADIEYTRYIMGLISEKNLYSLSEVMNITIWPPFLQNGMLVKYNGRDETVTIPAFVVGIGEGAFYNFIK